MKCFFGYDRNQGYRVNKESEEEPFVVNSYFKNSEGFYNKEIFYFNELSIFAL